MKKLSLMLLPIVFAACSQESTVEPVANTSTNSTEVSNANLPVFFFGENAERLGIDEATGAFVPKTLDRTTLTVADEEAFKNLKKDFAKKLADDKDYAGSVEFPADYACDENLLAINAEYDKVMTESGEVLLDDEMLMQDCIYAGDSKNVLAKKYVSSEPNDTAVFFTQHPYRLVGRTHFVDETKPTSKRDRDIYSQTWALKYVSYMGHYIYYPVRATYVGAQYGIFDRCQYIFDPSTLKRRYSCFANVASDYYTDESSFQTDDGYVRVPTIKSAITDSYGNDKIFAASKHIVVYGKDTLTAVSSTFKNASDAADVVKQWLKKY